MVPCLTLSRRPFFHCREKVLGNRSAKDILFKYQIVAVTGLKLNPNVSKLSMTARLLLVPALNLDFFPDRLPVGDTRLNQLHIHAEFALEAADNYVQMLLTQTGQNLLLSFGFISKVMVWSPP